MVKSHNRVFYNILVEVICFFDQDLVNFFRNNFPIAAKFQLDKLKHNLLK